MSVEGGKLMNLGQKIVKIRKDNKMSQEQFAEIFNVTRQTISSWENSKSYPDIETLIKISDKFNISLDILLKGDEKMIKNIDDNVKSNKRNKKLVFTLIIVLVVFIIAFAIIWTNSLLGFNNTKNDAKGNLYITCTLNDKKYFYNVNYGEDYRILAIDGDDYIMKNVNTDNAKNAKENIEIVKDYFKNNNGTCE